MDTVNFTTDSDGNIGVLLSDGAKKWLDGLRKVPKAQPIEVRREYMPQEVTHTPLYLATRLHIAELWLESQL